MGEHFDGDLVLWLAHMDEVWVFLEVMFLECQCYDELWCIQRVVSSSNPVKLDSTSIEFVVVHICSNLEHDRWNHVSTICVENFFLHADPNQLNIGYTKVFKLHTQELQPKHQELEKRNAEIQVL